VRPRRPFERPLARRHLVAQLLGQERAHVLAEPHGRREQCAIRHDARQHAPQHPLTEGPRHLFFRDLAADFHQPSILHARRTSGLAVAAGQTAVQMRLRTTGHLRAFDHLLDQIDASARAVELVAEQLVGGAGGRAETAMHALAQDRFCFDAVSGVANEVGEVGLHRALRSRGTAGRD
jgi:hypothetical protein